MDKRIIHMEGEGRYRMAITKYGRLGALRVDCSNSMVSLITNHSFFLIFSLICSLLVEVLIMNLLLVVLLYFMQEIIHYGHFGIPVPSA